jgi:hypothetical protein
MFILAAALIGLRATNTRASDALAPAPAGSSA